MAHDLVIRGGRIVDGTGAPAFHGDVAIDGGRIVSVGGQAGPGRREIGADGALVTPGFVDIHTHYDGQVTWDPYLEPSSWHGVTSTVMGNCGVGFAPATPDRHDWLIGLMEGVEDIPGSALAEGIRWSWEGFPEYLDALDRLPLAIDVGAQVPHGALRAFVMGERGARNEEPSAEDIRAMADLVEEALSAGALGFSSSRTMLHRSVDGDPVPGTFAGHDELIGIGRALGRAGHGVFEIATDFGIGNMHGRFRDDVHWMRDLSKETGRPVSFILAQSPRDPGQWRDIVRWAEQAVADGARILMQVGPRPAGILLGFDTNWHPFIDHPSFRPLRDRPAPEVAEALRDAAFRARLLAEETTDKGQFATFVFNHFAGMFPLGDPPDYEPTPETSIAARAAREGRRPNEVLLEAMLADEGRAMIYFPLLNYADGNFDAIAEMIGHPLALVSGSDGGAHCGLICDASTTTYMLSHWARDRRRGARLPLEAAVRKQTHDTASAYGLGDRGTLEPGMKADINVIDFDRLHIHAPAMVRDLPAGGRRLLQKVDGYLATIVAGQPIYEHGEKTGALPGRLIRGPQAATGK